MNWLAHIFLSEPTVENRLGNLLGDLVKGKDRDSLERNLQIGIQRHQEIDRFTDSHPIVRQSKSRITPEYTRFSGVLIDIFYDHLLANNWESYSSISLSDFTTNVYDSFQSYRGYLPGYARLVIQHMITGDWLTTYQSLAGVESALIRIEARIKSRIGRQINLVGAVDILDREYMNLEQDFDSFFSELQDYMHQYTGNYSSTFIDN